MHFHLQSILTFDLFIFIRNGIAHMSILFIFFLYTKSNDRGHTGPFWYVEKKIKFVSQIERSIEREIVIVLER